MSDAKELRHPKPDDQDQIDKAFLLIMDLMSKHPEVESTLWCGAVWSVLVNGYRESDFSYEEFSQEVINISKHYKCWWDNERMDQR